MHKDLVDRLVYELVSAYVEEKGVSTKSVNIDTTREICQELDARLLRVKKRPLNEAIEKALAQLRKIELQNVVDNGESGAPTDAESDAPLMVVPESERNKMNKSVTGLWNVPVVEKKSDTGNGEVSEKPKRKKRRVEATKRQTASVTLADLGGIDKIITQILELLAMPLSHPEVYIQLGSDIPRGVLLHGPPGCGKTMLANAIANELGVTFLNVSAPSVVSGMSGESEKKLREIFEEAVELAPSLIFIDEIDAITPKRENVQREMERRIVAQLLTCMDDVALDKTGGKPVMVIGATNRPDSIDPALRRGGRFDHEIAMTVPDQESRRRILETISRKLRIEGNFNFEQLAKMTPGFVGADLNALVSAAGVTAIKRIFKEMDTSEPVPKLLPVADTVALPDIRDTEMVDAEPKLEVPAEIAGSAEGDVVSVVQDTKDLTLEVKPKSLISRFLERHPDTLTAEQLEPLSITFDDFLTSIPTIQPSSKREGFATVPDITWEDVGAMNAIREELEYAIVEPIRRPEVYKMAGISAPSGVLLWGPPGCGKTLLAKAVANESRANFISIRGPELLNKYVGESERAVRQVFVRARASVPCVIFFDELDALVPRRDDSNSESASRVVNTLLTELDGVGERNGVFVVAATNRPDMIDAAMLRPGRLDKQLFVELPTPDERAEILKTVSRASPLSPDVDLRALAHDERCRNFSGADLAALVREASVLALKEVLKSGSGESIRVRSEHFDHAFVKVRPSVGDSERNKYYLMKERLAS